MAYGDSWELQSWAITLYMFYTFNRVRGFWNVSFLVVFFTQTAFDIVQYAPLYELLRTGELINEAL